MDRDKRNKEMLYKYCDWYIGELEKIANMPEAAEIDKEAEEKRERLEKEFKEIGHIFIPSGMIPYTHAKAIELCKQAIKDNELDIIWHFNGTQKEMNKICAWHFYSCTDIHKFPEKIKEFAKKEYEKKRYEAMTPFERQQKQFGEELDKCKKTPDENVGYAELLRRYKAKNKPQTSLSDEQIARFDRMSETWLSTWCNFSKNWLWALPCLVLCLFINKGLISAICLIAFMIAGEIYSAGVKEYCAVIIPWYQASGKYIEKRVLKK